VSSSLRSPAKTTFLVALLALLAFGSGARAAGGDVAAARSVEVVGSGDLNYTVTVRREPRRDSAKVTVLRQFRSSYRPQVVLALSRVTDPKTGQATWYKISVPGRPNGRTGWIPAGAAELEPVHKLIYIDRSERRLEFWKDGRLVLKTTVAVGRPHMETPLGLFYVQWKFVPHAPILGEFAFETSAYSKLSDWPGGGIVGIHGTFMPWLLGQAVSHGCVRMANQDVLKLRSLVGLGTPIKIVA